VEPGLEVVEARELVARLTDPLDQTLYSSKELIDRRLPAPLEHRPDQQHPALSGLGSGRILITVPQELPRFPETLTSLPEGWRIRRHFHREGNVVDHDLGQIGIPYYLELHVGIHAEVARRVARPGRAVVAGHGSARNQGG
jgi:hypothetical protein